MIEYAIARVRGLRRHLLGKRGLVELAAQPDRAARLELLRRVGLVSGRDLSLRAALRELRTNLGRDTAFVDELLEGTRERARLRAVLAIGDAWTLTTLLRGRAHHEPAARLLELVTPTLELDAGALKELASRRDVKDMIDLLATWGSPYAAPLLEVVARSEGQIDPIALETALTHEVVARAVAQGAGEPSVAAFLADVVDLANAVTLLKVGGKPATAGLFLAGGATLTRERFTTLAVHPAAEIHAALAADRALGLGDAFVDGRLDPLRLERLVARHPLPALRFAARTRPLSLAVPLLFLLERQEEVRAIRLILEGAELGLPGAELLDWALGAA